MYPIKLPTITYPDTINPDLMSSIPTIKLIFAPLDIFNFDLAIYSNGEPHEFLTHLLNWNQKWAGLNINEYLIPVTWIRYDIRATEKCMIPSVDTHPGLKFLCYIKNPSIARGIEPIVGVVGIAFKEYPNMNARLLLNHCTQNCVFTYPQGHNYIVWSKSVAFISTINENTITNLTGNKNISPREYYLITNDIKECCLWWIRRKHMKSIRK